MKIHYVTGSRADFGLIRSTLEYINSIPRYTIGVIATGQHFIPKYGETIKEVRDSGIQIVREIPVDLLGNDGLEMGFAFSKELDGFLRTFSEERPDLLLLLGDRGEMLAAAIAAVHCGVCVAHIHGGEVSGTIDESFRHAISKLSHYHFVATDDAAQRLVKMGEQEDRIFKIGAPGLVGIASGISTEDNWIVKQFGIEKRSWSILCVFHPVVQEAQRAAKQFDRILDLLIEQDCCGVIFRPNSDAGGSDIECQIERRLKSIQERFVVVNHLPRKDYLHCLANADLIVGNSSSGIIEAASFSTPNLCIGSRQSGRLRSNNTVDCETFDRTKLSRAFNDALSLKRSSIKNLYGEGDAHLRLERVLKNLDLTEKILAKKITY
jgi:UDP-hydrolysing UDP-N-acetyl-D-glucosamine 2-epimerase